MSVEITGVSYYNPSTGAYEASPPSIQRGQTAGIAIEVENDTPLERDVTVEVTITAPDGSTSSASDTKALAANASDIFYFTFVADQTGQYTASAEVTLGTKNFTNLLTNGDFESGDPPSNWTLYGAGATVVRSSEQVKTGSHSAKLTGGGVICRISQNVPGFAAYAGRTLTLSCQMYAVAANRARISLCNAVGSCSYSSHHSGIAGWEKLSVTRLVGATPTELRANLWVEVGDTYAYFDDVALYDADCCPGLVDTLAATVVTTVSVTFIEQITPIIVAVMGLALVGMMMRGMFKR